MTANSNQSANEPRCNRRRSGHRSKPRASKPPSRVSSAAGVTIDRPETCVIDPEVEVAAGTIIEPFAQLLGRTQRRRRLPHPFFLRH